jgi:hypothetical protein
LKQVRFHAVTLTAQGKNDNSGNLLKGPRRVAPHRARSGPACSWLDQRLPLQASLIGSRLMATCGLRVNRSVSATRASRPLYPQKQTLGDTSSMSASLIGRLGSSTFRLSTTAVLMSLTGSRFSSESAPGPFHYGIRGRGGTIFGSALPSDERQVQADIRMVRQMAENNRRITTLTH